MRTTLLAIPLLALLAVATAAAAADLRLAQAQPAQTEQPTPPVQPAQPTNEQVIEPSVVRRGVRIPKIPSKDFIVGAYAGTYATESFGTNYVYGLRLGYAVTEDIFVEAVYAQSEVNDSNFRQVLPGGVFPNEVETLTYYNLSAGYNLLPGEVFFGRNFAKASALYLMAGIGSTKFLEQRKLTLNYGLGLRVFLKDWASVQVDMRDHVYTLDLLGRRQSTHNLELAAGLTFYF